MAVERGLNGIRSGGCVGQASRFSSPGRARFPIPWLDAFRAAAPWRLAAARLLSRRRETAPRHSAEIAPRARLGRPSRRTAPPPDQPRNWFLRRGCVMKGRPHRSAAHPSSLPRTSNLPQHMSDGSIAIIGRFLPVSGRAQPGGVLGAAHLRHRRDLRGRRRPLVDPVLLSSRPMASRARAIPGRPG